MRGLFIRFLTINFLGLCLTTRAQVARQLGPDQGLPENTGQCIVQGAHGFIWIGTQNGLARYDGREIKVYKEQDGLSNNQIERLKFIDERFLLVATRNGLDRLDTYTGDIISFQPEPERSFETNWFRSMVCRGDSIYASTFYGLHVLDNDLQALNFYPNANQEERIWTNLYRDSIGNSIWYSSGLSIYQYHQGFLKPKFKTASRVLSMQRAGDSLLFGTEQGIFTLKQGEEDLRALVTAPEQANFVLEILRTRKGNLWFATKDGAFEFQNGNWRHYHSRARGDLKISHSLVLSLCEDAQSHIWLGTGQGLNIIDPRWKQFIRLNEESFGSELAQLKNVEVLHVDGEGRLWIGASDALYILVEDPSGDWKIESAGAPFEQEVHNIDYILEEPMGVFYVGTSNGELYRKKSDSWQKLVAAGNNKQLRGICPGRKAGELWLGFASGLYYWNEKEGLMKFEDLPYIPVVQMDIIDNELWLGSAKGLFRVDTATLAWKQYASGTGKGKLPNSLITDFYQQEEDIWLSSFGAGIYKYNRDQDSFEVFGEAEGLANPNVWAIYPDEKGRVWLSTDDGISSFDPKSERFENYNAESDGINFDDFSMTAHTSDSQGRIYFGNPKGITLFDPQSPSPDRFNIKPAIREVWVDYEPNTQVASNLLLKDELRLDPTYTNLDLFLSGFNFREGPLFWEFRIDNGDWKQLAGERLSLGRPEPGSYRLQIRNRNKDGFGDPSAFSVKWIVLPAFYETLWFKVALSFALFTLSGGLIYFFYRRRYLRRIKILETEQKIHQERERISKDLHDHVGAHLSRISSDLDLLELKLKGSQSPEESLEQLMDTRSFTSETIRLLRDTIWAIDHDDYSLAEFAQKIESFLDQYLADYLDWSFTQDSTFIRRLSSREVLNLLRILQEATQNMLKYSKANTFKVSLSGHNELNLEIEDDGQGFETDSINTESYGLKNMKERAEELGASFSLSANGGVRIVVRLKSD